MNRTLIPAHTSKHTTPPTHDTRTHTNTKINGLKHQQTPAHIHTHAHTHTHTHTHIHTHTHKHTQPRTYTPTHTHTNTQAPTTTHKHTPPPPPHSHTSSSLVAYPSLQGRLSVILFAACRISAVVPPFSDEHSKHHLLEVSNILKKSALQ